jgi:putative membrane protein (TIGR04086 family)
MPATYSTPAATRTSARRRSRRHQAPLWGKLLRGLLVSIAVTLGCVLLFALLIQWLKPDDGIIRIINQLIKLAAIFAGVRVIQHQSGEKNLIHGAILGLLYMALDVGLYALLSGQQLPLTAYLMRHRRGRCWSPLSFPILQVGVPTRIWELPWQS